MNNIYKLDNPESLMLENVMYFKKTKDNPEDKLFIMYKDMKNNTKNIKIINKPKMDVYITKPQYRDYDYNMSDIELEKVDKVSLEYGRLTTEIPKVLKDDQLSKMVQACFDNRDYAGLKRVHWNKNVFGSDMDIENYTYIQWMANYYNNLQKKPSCVYLDIETDIYHNTGFAKPETCPVDLVTIIDAETMTSHTFLLKTKDNPLIEPFIKDINSFREELHEAFDESYGRLTYKFYAYDDEVELLRDLFKLINSLKRTFVFVWNMSFDIPFIIKRLEHLGVDPRDIICDQAFPVKECYYVVDTRHFDRANKGDYFRCSSYSKYLCQLNSYAAIRKGGHSIPSYRLNNIGKRELNDEKLDYSEDGDIKTLSRRNYKKYVMYNIKDVLLQLGVGNKTKDADFIYLNSLSTFTKYDKIFKQTVFLYNVAYVNYLKQGYIIGNNINNDYSKPEDEDIELLEEKADGALVTDPLLNKNVGKIIMGFRSKFIYNNVIDMDFSSMYPNIIIAFNISRRTMIGKLIIERNQDEYYKCYNYESDSYDAGKEFMDNYLTGNNLMLGNKWFNLPNISDMNERFKKRFKIKEAA